MRKKQEKAVTVSLKLGEEVLESLELATGSEDVFVGRAVECHLRTPPDDKTVSGRHARIFWKGRTLYIEDAGSRNGLYVNGNRIKGAVKFEKGRMYAVGGCNLQVDEPAAAKPEKASRSRHRLGFEGGDREGEIVDIRPGEGSGEWTLGFSPECDLVLPDATVSRRHAVIAVRGDECWISDAGSRNGTYVNGERLHRERLLHPGDKISISWYTLQFDPRPSPLKGVAAVLSVTAILGAAAFVIWWQGRPSADDYLSKAAVALEAENFAGASNLVEMARDARGAKSARGKIEMMSAKVKNCAATCAGWREVVKILKSNKTYGVDEKLSTMLSSTENWSWNAYAATNLMPSARFAKDALDVQRKTAASLAALKGVAADPAEVENCAKEIDRFLSAGAADFEARPYLSCIKAGIEDTRTGILKVKDGIDRVSAALKLLSGRIPDFGASCREMSSIAGDATLSPGVRRYAASILPACRALAETAAALDREEALVCSCDFGGLAASEDPAGLPSPDDCARSEALSAARAALVKRHRAILEVAATVSPTVGKLAEAKITPESCKDATGGAGESGRWLAALEFDCFKSGLPRSSRQTPSGVYDELFGVEYFYGFISSLADDGKPNRDSSPLEFKPLCRRARDVYMLAERFARTMDNEKCRRFDKGRLAALHANCSRLLEERDSLVDFLRREAGSGSLSSARQIAASAAAIYFTEAPGRDDIRRTGEAFKRLKSDVLALNNAYQEQSDPAEMGRLRKKIISTAIPGDPSARQAWIDTASGRAGN